jgi:hypothetical protein
MRTWKRYMLEFWPEAIARVKAKAPGFLFLAEVYWDLEWELMQHGFDYCYDKRLYDRLLFGQARTIRDHLRANLTFQEKLMRFLENHDETRAAVSLGVPRQMAAAAVTYFLPGMRFFHAGQEKGLRTRIPVHLGRGPAEQALPGLEQFYGKLFKVLQQELFSYGDWLLLDCRPAWADDQGHEHFLVYFWLSNVTREKILVAVNYSGERQKCYVRLPYLELAGKNWTLEDLMGDQAYERDGSQLVSEGLYLDMPEWGYHVFRFQQVRS